MGCHLLAVQWQQLLSVDFVILKQHNGFPGDLSRQLLKLREIQSVIWVRFLWIKQAKPDQSAKVTPQSTVNICHIDHPQLISFSCPLDHSINIIREAVNARLQSLGNGLRMRSKILMTVYGLFHIAAIAHHMMYSPLLLGNFLHFMIQDRRYTINLIVRGHHCLGATLCYGATEWLQIILMFIPRINRRRLPDTSILHIVGIKML